ncbi:klotho-like [Salvelinus sp. IW2-2015]|uniref:klotho-like n=1 Tax=Salvelinus sp. IW2-2015 TaxID=2691554 RepID=UPI0038D39FDF
MDWVEPAFSFSREDVEPANRVLDCRVGWFSEPIFGSGDYPPRMRNWFHQRHSLDLFHYHLPLFSEEDRQLVRGTYDFFAISHFSTQLVTPTIEEQQTSLQVGVQYMGDITGSGPSAHTPRRAWGLRKALNW